MKRKPGRTLSRLVSFYGVLLRFFPRQVRQEFGREMEELLLDLVLAEQRRRGTPWALWILVLAFAEVPFRALIVRRDEWRLRRRNRNRARYSAERKRSGRSGGLGPRLDRFLEGYRHALRRLLKAPGLTAVAILSLAVGIGANTAVFSLIDATILRDRPYDRPEELVYVLTNRGFGTAHTDATLSDLHELETLADVFSGISAYRGHLSRTREDGETKPIHVEVVSPDMLSLLGIRPVVGRTFPEEDDPSLISEPSALLNWEYWQRRFDGSPSVLGRSVEISGHPVVVVGVMPKEYTSLVAPGVRSEILVPMAVMDPLQEASDRRPIANEGSSGIKIMGRLQPGVSPEEAQARLDDLGERLSAKRPDLYRFQSFSIAPVSDVIFHPTVDRALISVGAMLLVALILVLLLACTNLMIFLFSQGLDRRKETAIRLALGVSRKRLITEFLAETSMLVFLGAVVGLALARWSLGLLATALPSDLVSVVVDYGSVVLEDGLNPSAYLFSLGLAVITGALAGVLPALLNSKPEIGPALRDEGVSLGFRRQEFHGVLVAMQVGISVVLLVAGGLFLRSLQAARHTDPGFSTKNAGVVWVDLWASGVPSAEWYSTTERIVARAVSIPGIQDVGLSRSIPLMIGGWSGPFRIPTVEPKEGRGHHMVIFSSINPAFFSLMGMGVVAGRGITELDLEKTEPVVVVNQAAASRFWPGKDALGKEVSPLQSGRSHRVVGIVRDAKSESPGESWDPQFFFPFAQLPTANVRFVARGEGPPAETAALLRYAVHSVDPDLVIVAESTLEAQRSILFLPSKFAAALLSGFGIMALILACVGLYGAVDSGVRYRTREIVIRIAMGAEGRDVIGMVLVGILGTVLAGAALGLTAALGISRLLGQFLIGVGPHDPLILTVVPSVLILVALLAALPPAIRASRSNAAGVLRFD